MAHRRLIHTILGCGMTVGMLVTAAATRQPPLPLTIGSGKLTIIGSSNVHEWEASTTAVRVIGARLSPQSAGAAPWSEIVKPGALATFEIAVAAGTLKSNRDGLDKNMYKALKTAEHKDITFRLTRLETAAAPGALLAVGKLTIAGVEREITFQMETQLQGASLLVRGTVPLVMTEFGIAPPKAMLGMLKTDPNVKVIFEVLLSAADAAGIH
ncbi:MAG: YceI family protein [Vicinamibacterales bacterium]